MFARIALLVAVAAIACHAAPTPGGGGHHKHVVIHVPYKVHTIHHHHVSKVPVVKEVHVPVYKEVPVIKHVEIEKPVYVPVPYKEHKGWESKGWESKGWESDLHGWL